MSAHTPRPWVANGSAIEDRPKRGPATVIAYGVELAADAHLMAAAPDMLAALKNLTGIFAALHPNATAWGDYQAALAAIAKARGGK